MGFDNGEWVTWSDVFAKAQFNASKSVLRFKLVDKTNEINTKIYLLVGNKLNTRIPVFTGMTKHIL
ncbi:hypothetical protein EAX61_06620 [Dokdonia sinensis]|uniref:Uncharacterized protein n=1 Tax=Dokdonia sinensis TaxID=2479847 RepID=A0A3M0G620_9FLAO|nr:hypothetical protein EAX61_06620 [Dokdonia sinensis]